MALVVTHNSTADGDPLIDGDDWNANHTITGGGTFEVLELIESVVLDDDTTYTFADLDGDNDQQYVVKFNFKYTTTPERMIYLRPGGATAADFKGNEWLNLTNVDANGVGFLITSGSWSTGITWGELTINAVSGVRRTAYNKRVNNQSDTLCAYIFGKSWWNNTTTNITSLVLTVASGNSVDGWIKLYRVKDLVI